MPAAHFRVAIAMSLAACALTTPAHTDPAAIAYVSRIMDINRMGLTVTNYGFVGNNFVSRSASMEYPLGTGYEHLVRGGVWDRSERAR